jgi:pimeloyl-ACP methyl ester carboxylesterase
LTDEGDAMAVRKIAINGIELNLLDEGQGPPVLLLHGFPDSHRLWRHQVPALRDAGLRVLAPDLRGFGESTMPKAVDDYALMLVVQDIVALLDALGVERTHVVCHDWGAAAGWVLASLHPQRVEQLVALSVGHPNATLQAGLDQREKAWYMLLFQFEGVAEELLQRDDWRLMRDFARHHAECEQWIADLSRPGALTAALNWYRANAHPKRLLGPPRLLPNVQAPTLGIWSSDDRYLVEASMARSGEFVDGPWRYERIEGASHWMQLDRPRLVNRLIVEFLTASA